MTEHSLLTEGMFHVGLPIDGVHAGLTLPQVLARLPAGEDLQFTSLRPHQAPAWHAFLVQLAFLALEDQDEPQTAATAEVWCQHLLALTAGQGDEAAWCLVNSDWQQPCWRRPKTEPNWLRFGSAPTVSEAKSMI